MSLVHFLTDEFREYIPAGTLLFALIHLLNVIIALFLLFFVVTQSVSLFTDTETHLLGIILCIQLALSGLSKEPRNGSAFLFSACHGSLFLWSAVDVVSLRELTSARPL